MAAGQSTRMGSPKPLLKWGNITLIQHIINQIKMTNIGFSLILGSVADEVIQSFSELNFPVMVNKQWQSGMGSSIQYAINDANKKNYHPLILLLDQPLILGKHIWDFYQFWTSDPKNIAVCSFDNLWSPPVIIPNHLLGQIPQLKTDKGAKNWIKTQKFKKFPLIEASINMNTMEDYLNLRPPEE